MKLIRQTYRDKLGNDWVIEKVSLPKKRGEYTFWAGECGNRSFKAETKTLLKQKIEDHANNKQQTEV